MARRHTEAQTLPLLEFATLLGISDSHAYKLAREDGHIAGVVVFKVGHKWMVLRAPAMRVLSGESLPVIVATTDGLGPSVALHAELLEGVAS